MNTQIIGDIHGCYYTLISLLKKLKIDYQKDKIIFLGDYIDRGLHSYKTVHFLIRLQNLMGEDRCICLMGNHEYMMLYDYELWQYNGGQITKNDYNRHGVSYNTHRSWIARLPLYYEDEEIICSHAGVPHADVSECTQDELLWSRDHFEKDIKRDKMVFFGHTPANSPFCTRAGDLCIDTSCVFGGRLTAVQYSGNKKYKIISVLQSAKD